MVTIYFQPFIGAHFDSSFITPTLYQPATVNLPGFSTSNSIYCYCPLQWPRHSVYPHTKNRDFSTSRDRSPGCLFSHRCVMTMINVDVFGLSGTGPLDGCIFGCTEFVIMGNLEGTFLSESQILTKMQEGFDKHLDFEKFAGISGNKTCNMSTCCSVPNVKCQHATYPWHSVPFHPLPSKTNSHWEWLLGGFIAMNMT